MDKASYIIKLSAMCSKQIHTSGHNMINNFMLRCISGTRQ